MVFLKPPHHHREPTHLLSIWVSSGQTIVYSSSIGTMAALGRSVPATPRDSVAAWANFMPTHHNHPTLSRRTVTANSTISVTAPLTTTELGDVAVLPSTFPRGCFSYRPLQMLLLSCSLTPNPLPTFAALLNSSGNWLLGAAWKLASQKTKALCEKTRQLMTAPEPGFAPQRTITVADALLLEWAALPPAWPCGFCSSV